MCGCGFPAAKFRLRCSAGFVFLRTGAPADYAADSGRRASIGSPRYTAAIMSNSNESASGASSATPNKVKPWEHAKSGEGSGSDPLAERFVESISYDTRMYRQDIAGSLAHARMLQKVGLISGDELKQIESGLREIEDEITEQGTSWPGWRVELEDVHMCIEAALIEKAGDAGRKLHTGRSRNDQVALDLKLWIEDAAGELQQRFDGLFKAIVKLAEQDGLLVMPSYTHLQRAQPIVVGAELMAWAAMLDRAQRRLTALRTVNKRNPLGSGAIAGSSLPLDRAVSAELLNVGPPTASSIDSTSTRDAAQDFVYAMSMIAQVLSRWAEQWIIYASTEFSFITLDGRYTTGSSMMPQKQNPDMLELIRGRCGNVYGSLVSLMTICKGLSIGYNRDLQEDKRHVFAAYDVVMDAMDMASRIIATTRFNGEKIRKSLDRGFADATSLADYFVNRGVPFRTAHQVVAQLVRRCQQQNLEQLSALPIDEFNAVCSEMNLPADSVAEDVADWLGAENVVKRYTTAGNGGVSGFQMQLKAWQDRLNAG